MRLQDLPWSCGPAALVNAARALGKKISERKIRGRAGTTQAEGTDEFGLIAAARELGFSAVQNYSVDGQAAWAFVRANILDGRPCLLCIDLWDHWVTAIGLIGDRVIVVDPSNATTNRREQGVHCLTRKNLLKRWRHRTAEEPFYSIALGL